MDYQAQLRFKERKVYNDLKRIGGLKDLRLEDMEPIMGMETPWRYRNKAQFPFGLNKDGRIITGFYAGRTHSIIEQEDCLLGIEENKEILEIYPSSLWKAAISAVKVQGLMTKRIIKALSAMP